MKLIESKAEYIPQAEGIDGIYKQIELAGRTCYKSEDKITEDSAKSFVERMIKSNHTAMLEHGTVYLKIERPLDENSMTCLSKYNYNKYSKCFETYDLAQNIRKTSVTTNFRVIVENNWYDDLVYLCEPTELHERRYTFRFTTDRGVSHELVRHRVFSFAQESTRYCNYSNKKYGGEITFIIPSWFQPLKEEGNYEGEIRDGSNRIVLGGKTFQLSSVQDFYERYMYSRLAEIENAYFHFLKHGYTPQQARAVLPNATKTEICMTGFASDWRYFFDLRYFGKTGAPHPDMKILAFKAKIEAEHNKIWNNIVSYKSKFE